MFSTGNGTYGHIAGGSTAVDLVDASPEWFCSTGTVITAFGIVALTFMMTMYALEHRADAFIAAFAAGCALSSAYGFLAGAWPFGVVEAIWCIIAARRYQQAIARQRHVPG